MKVLKFGGTSVGSPQRMFSVAELINNNEPKIVVLSAMSGTTNSLVEIAETLKSDKEKGKSLINALYDKYKKIVFELYENEAISGRALKFIDKLFAYLIDLSKNPVTMVEEKIFLAQGEILSTNLFTLKLEELKINAVLLSALDFMSIDENDEPELPVISEKLNKILHAHPECNIFITQGYICRNPNNGIDNLKRGGSDYSASLIGAAVEATEIQIWTDIDGMHNNDPRIVDKTFPIAELSFDEAAELAYFGAKILHPSSVLPAKLKNIPVRLLNTMQPDAKGTTICSNISGNNITAVAAKDGIIAVKIKSGRMLLAYGFLRSIFQVFEKHKTPIDMITTSEVAVSLTIDKADHLDKIINELTEFGSVEVDRDQTIVCVVGDFMAEKPGYAFKVFEALKHIPIRMISYGGSKNNISLLVNSEYKKDSLQALNDHLFFNAVLN